MRRISGTEAADRGLTLLEMLVVVAVLALVIVAVPGFFAGGPPKAEATLRALEAGLARARSEAIRTGRPAALVFDLETRRVTGPGTEIALPEGLELTIESAAEASERGRPRIVFFGDGSGSGGRVAVTGAEGGATLEVRWLTGAVRRDG